MGVWGERTHHRDRVHPGPYGAVTRIIVMPEKHEEMSERGLSNRANRQQRPIGTIIHPNEACGKALTHHRL